MTSYYDEVEIEDFEWDEDAETYFYPCPCGDRFQITKVRIFCPTRIKAVFNFKNTQRLLLGSGTIEGENI